ncbi:lariat debranching enzyme isoform X1 [Neodiprion pinetum]|uniref:lariat debranching enzyme isoform X1 n=1 Tax=Neodiprion pinetum TaxID=441929 RepID=UPI001EE0C265|nr:lariat debranching enzyme [Neodiprion pinetum]
MRIAVEGCAHGELEIIYDTILQLEKIDGKKIDLLICCGDFQSTRNLNDLHCMAVPDKYKDMCTFYKYYSGEKIAPILTIFIGGNHEASNYLQELPYGGWVATNIYYLGYAGVINVAGIRIAGISGIYKSHNWMQGHYEKPPYTDKTLRSVYHTRNLEIFRIKQISSHIDIFLSHDWPSGITKYGNEAVLLRNKPYFREDIANDALGSQPFMDLLQHHYPSFWFAAHLHCKFAAIVPEENGKRITKFLALDKCLPKRKFLQVLEIDHNDSLPLKISYDLEWLTILFLTNHLLSVKHGLHYMPGPAGNGRWIYTPSNEEKENILKKFNHDLEVPDNFKCTVPPYRPESPDTWTKKSVKLQINPQTTEFCNLLGIDDPVVLLQMVDAGRTESKSDDESSTDVSNMRHESRDMSSTSIEADPEKFSLGEDNDTERTIEFEASFTVPSPSKNLDLPSEQDESAAVNITTGNELQISNMDGDDSPVQMEPNCKKFKRRNYSIYSSTL